MSKRKPAKKSVRLKFMRWTLPDGASVMAAAHRGSICIQFNRADGHPTALRLSRPAAAALWLLLQRLVTIEDLAPMGVTFKVTEEKALKQKKPATTRKVAAGKKRKR